MSQATLGRYDLRKREFGELTICVQPLRAGYREAYVILPPDHPWIDGITDSVSVHGGITRNETDKDGNLLIGFHAGHPSDGRDPSLVGGRAKQELLAYPSRASRGNYFYTESDMFAGAENLASRAQTALVKDRRRKAAEKVWKERLAARQDSEAKFFTFRQNMNRGTSEGPAIAVIEALSWDHANTIAETLTSTEIYFDGVRDGIDCSCGACGGDRWVRIPNGFAGDMVPTIDGRAITREDGAMIFFLDGEVIRDEIDNEY